MNLHYKELSDRAFYYHSNNKFDEAEEIYKQLLNINPDDVNVLNLIGLLYLATNRFPNAITYLSKAFILKKTPYITSNLAKAYYLNNEPENAIKLYEIALESGKSDDIYYSIALAYKKLKDYDKLIYYYQKALELNPRHYSSLYNLSIAFKEQGNIPNALFFANKCLEIKNDDEELYSLLSNYYEDLNKYEEAIESLNKAISLNNNNYLYLYNLGVLYARVGKTEQAEAAYLKSIELNPTYFQTYVNLSTLYKEKNDNNKALEYLLIGYKLNSEEENIVLSLAQTYRSLYKNAESKAIIEKFIINHKDCADAYSILAMNYMDEGDYHKALEYYEVACKLEPKNLNYMHGKAIALKYIGNIEQAQNILEYIVQNNKNNIQSAVTLGMIYLTEKDFDKGMELYSLRRHESKFKNIFTEKIWNKETDIEGKNILLYSDCGLGDTIMCARYLPLLKEKAQNITLQTDKELISILKNSYPNISVIRKSEVQKDYDVVMPVMDVQYALNSDFNSIPYKDGYLTVNQEQIEKFSNLEEIKGKNNKIGLFWQGNKRIFKNRSIPFEYINKLVGNTKYNFYSLQTDIDIESANNFCSLKQYVNDYNDTAALLKNMDLLITIDSSIVHMAGAIGVKTLLLLPKTAEWRWFNDTNECSWYNSVKIIKQNESGNWDEVINRVIQEL